MPCPALACQAVRICPYALGEIESIEVDMELTSSRLASIQICDSSSLSVIWDQLRSQSRIVTRRRRRAMLGVEEDEV